MALSTRSINTSRLKAPKLSKQQRAANHSAAAEMNIRTRVAGKRGERNRSILVEFERDGVEHSFHATKGWRHTRVRLAASDIGFSVDHLPRKPSGAFDLPVKLDDEAAYVA